MKYWRGYLVAAILAACTWGFREFAETHSKLVDMVYPYVTRLVQNFMAGWSGEVAFCLWQAILLALIAVGVATVVLMIIFKWNPIQWFGWILSAVALITLLHTGVFGMNEYAGPLAEDIRLAETDCTDDALEAAAVYYRDMANAINSAGTMEELDLAALNNRAANGFDALVYEEYFSVFAGSKATVKELSMADWFTKRGEMGYTAAITGEAAINPDAPAFMKPYAVCREMCYRMCIASERDKHFGAFLTCQANDSVQFQYAGYVMAYRYCLKALPQSVASIVNAQANTQLREDVEAWDAFVAPAEALAAEKAEKEGVKDETDREIAELLVSWHHQEVVIPSITEPEVIFDPMDESQVDLTGLPHIQTPTESVEEAA